MSQHITTPKQEKWVLKLFGYDYAITYRPGKENVAADALSRQVSGPSLDTLFICKNQVWEDIKTETQQQPHMQKLKKSTLQNPDNPYSLRDGLVLYKNRVVLPPPKSPLIQQLLQAFHDSPIGGQSRVL